MASKSIRGVWLEKKNLYFLSLLQKRIELQNPLCRTPQTVGLRLLFYTHYATVWAGIWKRILLGVIKHTEMTAGSGSLLN